MYSHWQQSPGLPAQPIQPWQLADAHHAAQSSQARLAEAEHAFAREIEQLLTTIAAHEHSAKIRDASIRDLRAKLDLRDGEIATANLQRQQTIDECEKRVTEYAQEYSAETRRMREVVSSHQRSAAKHQTEIEELKAKLQRSESACNETNQNNKELIQRIESLTRQRESESIELHDKLNNAMQLLTESQDDVTNLQQQLDETETQHNGDVESLRQEVADATSLLVERDQTIQDLDQLANRHLAELTDAQDQNKSLEARLAKQENSRAVESELFKDGIAQKQQKITALQNRIIELEHDLQSHKSEMAEVVQLTDSIDSQLSAAVASHAKEVERLQATMSAREQEVDLKKSELRELANTLVQRELEFKGQIDEAQQQAQAHVTATTERLTAEIERHKQNTAESRKRELRDLATNLVRRETEFRTKLDEAKRAAETKMAETTTHYNSELERLQDFIRTLEKSADDRETIVDGLNQQLEQLSQEHQATLQRVQQESAEHSNRLTREQSDRVQTMQSELTETQSKLDAAEQRLQSTESQLQQTREQLAAVQNDPSAQHEIERLTDAQQQSYRQSQQLLVQIDQLCQQHAIELQQRDSEIARYVAQIEDLRQMLASQDRDSQTVAEATVAEAIDRENQLKQEIAALQTVKVDSQQRQARVQQLTAQLAVAQANQTRSEQEKQQLAASLSKQETEHKRQTKTVYDQLASLQETNKQLQIAVRAKTDALAKSAAEANQLKKQIVQLKSIRPPASTDESTLKKYRQHISQLKHRYTEQLEKCQRAEFAVTQLDRTVAWLEQNASSLQGELQREAAARRKAESVLKRRAGQAGADAVDQAVSAKIELTEQIKRLTRELDATQKIRLIERQQAETELKKIRRELAKRKSKNSRAA